MRCQKHVDSLNGILSVKVSETVRLVESQSVSDDFSKRCDCGLGACQLRCAKTVRFALSERVLWVSKTVRLAEWARVSPGFRTF